MQTTQLVIDDLINKNKQLTTQIDALIKKNPNVNHTRKKDELNDKRKWEMLVHTRYCVQQVLVDLYDYET